MKPVWSYVTVSILCLLIFVLVFKLFLIRGILSEAELTAKKNVKEVADLYTLQIQNNTAINAQNNIIDLIDINGTHFWLKSLITRPTLIFRFTEDYCEICINEELNKLEAMGNMIGNTNLLLLVSYSNLRALGFLKKQHHIKFSIYNVPKDIAILKNIQQLSTPFYFTVGPDLILNDFFIPDKSFP